MRRLCLVALFVAFAPDAHASCEFLLDVRGPGFTYVHNGTWPYVHSDSSKAVRDSLYTLTMVPVYQEFAAGLSEIVNLYRKISPDSALLAAMQRQPVTIQAIPRRPTRRWKQNWETPDEPSASRIDSLLKLDLTVATTVYSVQIGGFTSVSAAKKRVERLGSLRRTEKQEVVDSEDIVDWKYSTCAGYYRPRLFILEPTDGPGSQTRVLHGLFIDRRDAVRARAHIRSITKLTPKIVKIPITPDLIRQAFEQQMK